MNQFTIRLTTASKPHAVLQSTLARTTDRTHFAPLNGRHGLMDIRGAERESQLEHSVYFSDHYFSLTQLVSLSEQIHEIHKLKPADVLEVGLGNGFVSSFLQRAGYDVVTVDINAALNPDICAPIAEMNDHLEGREFDLVTCCEVLEHMPLSELDANLEHLRSAGRRLFLTLPNYNASVGFGGYLRMPKLQPTLLGCHIDIRRQKDLSGSQHFWEVGSEQSSRHSEIVRRLSKLYKTVSSQKFSLNPYHLAYYAS